MNDDEINTEIITSIVNQATANTILYRNGEINIFNNKLINENDRSDLQNYYKQHIENMIKSITNRKTILKKLKNFQELIEREPEVYKEKLFELANASLTTIFDSNEQTVKKFLNPLTEEVEILPDASLIDTYLSPQLDSITEERKSTTTSLPVLEKDSQIWKDKIKNILGIEENISNEQGNFVNIPEPGTEKVGEKMDTNVESIPSNSVIPTSESGNGSDSALSFSIDDLRQKLIPTMAHSQNFYLMQLRNYLRILRRLWIKTLLRKNLMTEVTYVKFPTAKKFSINHKFFKNNEVEVHLRFYKTMRMNHFRSNPYDRKKVK